ncbi:unnamed protein product, partial [Phaeothamnion confervicola]
MGRSSQSAQTMKSALGAPWSSASAFNLRLPLSVLPLLPFEGRQGMPPSRFENGRGIEGFMAQAAQQWSSPPRPLPPRPLPGTSRAQPRGLWARGAPVVAKATILLPARAPARVSFLLSAALRLQQMG